MSTNRTRTEDYSQQGIDYLLQLRSELEAIRAPTQVIETVGQSIVAQLSTGQACSVEIIFDDDTFEFGSTTAERASVYEHALEWDGDHRGRLLLRTQRELSDVERRMLVVETAGYLGRVLRARELELQLIQSARMVSLGEMAAGVAHELNQPLMAISATAESLLLLRENGMEIPGPELDTKMGQVLEMVDRMASIIQHMRSLARDSNGSQTGTFEVCSAIEMAREMMMARLRSYGIELILELDDSLPKVRGSAQQLEQVILNLLANALDALNERAEEERDDSWTKRIAIRTRRSDDAAIEIVVEDSGTGMEAATVDRLFEPFFTTKAVNQGLGLGLSISRSIIKGLGGSVACTSRKGIGTTFNIVLPVVEG